MTVVGRIPHRSLRLTKNGVVIDGLFTGTNLGFHFHKSSLLEARIG